MMLSSTVKPSSYCLLLAPPILLLLPSATRVSRARARAQIFQQAQLQHRPFKGSAMILPPPSPSLMIRYDTESSSPATAPAAINPPPNTNITKPFGVPSRRRQGPLPIFPATAIDLEDTPASPFSPPPSNSQLVRIAPVTRENINAFIIPTKNLQLTCQRNLLDQREVMDV